jgi:hypothetical protein
VTQRPRVILSNGATPPPRSRAPLRLDYRPGHKPNVNISLPNFVQTVFHLPPRILDLLEIASYVFSADRLLDRGDKDAVEYHRWSRSLHFVIKVRDLRFWRRPLVRVCLADALCWMSGDYSYSFTFQPGHSTPPTSLFDSEAFSLPPTRNAAVALFSGGLDSFAGLLDLPRKPPVPTGHDEDSGGIARGVL